MLAESLMSVLDFSHCGGEGRRIKSGYFCLLNKSNDSSCLRPGELLDRVYNGGGASGLLLDVMRDQVDSREYPLHIKYYLIHYSVRVAEKAESPVFFRYPALSYDGMLNLILIG
jgi:hypothetical protein